MPGLARSAVGAIEFGVNVRKQVWNCRGCGKGGDVIALVQHVEGLPFQAAVERLTGEQIERERTRLPEAPKRQLEPDDKRIHDFSRKIAARVVSEIVPLIGTPGETYLRDVRKIDANSDRRRSQLDIRDRVASVGPIPRGRA